MTTYEETQAGGLSYAFNKPILPSGEVPSGM